MLATHERIIADRLERSLDDIARRCHSRHSREDETDREASDDGERRMTVSDPLYVTCNLTDTALAYPRAQTRDARGQKRVAKQFAADDLQQRRRSIRAAAS
jgi:hypothetical protein